MAIHLVEAVQYLCRWAAVEVDGRPEMVVGSAVLAAVAAVLEAEAQVRVGSNAKQRISQQAGTRSDHRRDS